MSVVKKLKKNVAWVRIEYYSNNTLTHNRPLIKHRLETVTDDGLANLTVSYIDYSPNRKLGRIPAWKKR